MLEEAGFPSISHATIHNEVRRYGELHGKQMEKSQGIFKGGEEFWETFSAKLSQIYDLSDTMICVNGDGAAWIQETVKEYFPNAVFSWIDFT